MSSDDDDGDRGEGAGGRAGLNPAELAVLKGLARRQQGLPPRVEWAPAAPTSAAVLEELGERRTESGAPAGRDYVPPAERRLRRPWPAPELPGQREERLAREQERREFYAQLGPQAKTQVAADHRWPGPPAGPDEPLWCVQMVSVGRAPDAAWPPVVLRAATSADAQKKYQSLCGILGWDHDKQEIVATPWVPPAEEGAP